MAREHQPDVMLMDIRMPGTDGLAATGTISADPALADVHILILTTFEEDEYVFEAIRVGASGFLVKDTEPAELVHAVRVVAGGDALLSPGVTRRLIGEFATRAKKVQSPTTLDVLTEREREVVALVGEGLTNDEIAARLVVSPATAKTHVSRAMIKLAPGTGRSWWCWPTSRGWSGPAGLNNSYSSRRTREVSRGMRRLSAFAAKLDPATRRGRIAQMPREGVR